MRVLIAGGEEKGEEPTFSPIHSPSEAGDGQIGAGVTPAQQALPSSISAGENANLQDGREPAATSSKEAIAADDEPDATNGKQRASVTPARPVASREESSSDEVHLDGSVKEESDPTEQYHRVAVEGEQRASRGGAAGADTSQGSGLT